MTPPTYSYSHGKTKDIGLGPEMAELSQMFRECFNYEVLEYPIPSNDPKSSLNLEVARFFHLFGQRDDSLIYHLL